MPDAPAELRRHQRRGESGVHVAVHQHQVGAELGQDRLEPLHHGRRLLGVRARAHPEVVVGRGNPQVLEEEVRHVRVVVLTGVHDDVLEVATLGQLAIDRRELHEIGARPDDGEDAH